MSDLDAALVSPEWECYKQGETAGVLQCIFTSVTTRQPKDGWFQNVGGSPSQPDQPSLVTIDRPTLDKYGCPGEACTWMAIAYSNGVVVGAEFQFRIEIQYGDALAQEDCRGEPRGEATIKC